MWASLHLDKEPCPKPDLSASTDQCHRFERTARIEARAAFSHLGASLEVSPYLNVAILWRVQIINPTAFRLFFRYSSHFLKCEEKRELFLSTGRQFIWSTNTCLDELISLFAAVHAESPKCLCLTHSNTSHLWFSLFLWSGCDFHLDRFFLFITCQVV